MKKQIVFFVMTILLFTGCSNNNIKQEEVVQEEVPAKTEDIIQTHKEDIPVKTEDIIEANKEDIEQTPIVYELGGWIIYWDYEAGLNEFNRSKDLIKKYELDERCTFDSVSLFAYDFYSDASLHSNSNINIDDISEGTDIFITIVNDVMLNENYDYLHKDSSIIERILYDDKLKKAHIDELCLLASDSKITGIEIDYENLDEALWDDFVLFIDELYEELSKNDKKLRVVLEPAYESNKNFNDDCEYIIMAYELHGTHSGEGPKADREFIENLTKKADADFTNYAIAFSLGGFDWSENGDVDIISMIEAEQLMAKYSAKENRDEQSQTVYFTYGDGQKHSVWYSDAVTINYWMDVAQEKGADHFILWHLGGSVEKGYGYD